MIPSSHHSGVQREVLMLHFMFRILESTKSVYIKIVNNCNNIIVLTDLQSNKCSLGENKASFKNIKNGSVYMPKYHHNE